VTDFMDATGNYRVTVGTRVMVRAVSGIYDLLVIRTYWNIESSPALCLIDLRGKSGKRFDRVNPSEVAVCLEFFGEFYAPVSFIGSDFVPEVGTFVLIWSERFHNVLRCEVMQHDNDTVALRYGKAISMRSASDCYVSLSDFREAHSQM
jgi:hypothetical protein